MLDLESAVGESWDRHVSSESKVVSVDGWVVCLSVYSFDVLCKSTIIVAWLEL
jgi:hypothetical protein